MASTVKPAVSRLCPAVIVNLVDCAYVRLWLLMLRLSKCGNQGDSLMLMLKLIVKRDLDSVHVLLCPAIYGYLI